MTTEAEVQATCERLENEIQDEANDTQKYTVEQSLGIYEYLSHSVQAMIDALREDLRDR